MEKAYEFRIYPTSEQETLLQKTFGCATLNYYACSADLTHLKKERIVFESLINSRYKARFDNPKHLAPGALPEKTCQIPTSAIPKTKG